MAFITYVKLRIPDDDSSNEENFFEYSNDYVSENFNTSNINLFYAT